jgi:outer membrane protein OmpA-like peptidoglycan-associated protein
MCSVPAVGHGQQTPDSVWRNYDFVPGKRVLKVINVDSQQVGRFPASLLEHVRGNMQVVELNGKRWLEATGNGVFRLKLPEVLDESFTVEFTVQFPTANIGTAMYTGPVSGTVSRYPGDFIQVSARPGIYNRQGELSAVYRPKIVKQVLDVKLQVDKEYAIMYVDAERVGQAPVSNFARSKSIEFAMSANQRFPNYIADIVVAVGLDPLYESLTTKGEATTRGLLFDFGSDRLRDESAKALRDLVDALSRAANLNVDIEGHTDAVGDAAANQQLSERRAAAVVAYLSARGITPSRLRAVGMGESTPVASNDTPEGRQENRRVVIRVRK